MPSQDEMTPEQEVEEGLSWRVCWCDVHKVKILVAYCDDQPLKYIIGGSYERLMAGTLTGRWMTGPKHLVTCADCLGKMGI